MSFGTSSHLANLFEAVSEEEMRPQIAKLLEALGSNDVELLGSLTKTGFRRHQLDSLKLWNDRISPNPYSDDIGRSARIYWAAQELQALFPKPFEPAPSELEPLGDLFEKGGNGLFEIGKDQFSKLAEISHGLTAWIVDQNIVELIILESPLGNTLPVQIIEDLLADSPVKTRVELWNAPRNDRASRGRTVSDSAREISELIGTANCVLFVDDALTGTRFRKLFDALKKELQEVKFVPVALLIEDTRPKNTQDLNKAIIKLQAVQTYADQHSLPYGVVRFPGLPLFRIDECSPVSWEYPMAWGDNDLVAGKRKVNLIFNLLDHALNILTDLGSERSSYREKLEYLWSQNTQGEKYLFSPGLTKEIFEDWGEKLELESFYRTLWIAAKTEFSDDYKGKNFTPDNEQVMRRWMWLAERFKEEAGGRIGEKESYALWFAIDCLFAATIHKSRPRANRDHDYSQYALPFNDTIRKLNRQLRNRILECIT